jgi:O-acetyl-ADP-ribose deacetylase (regulator of RNase III)
VPPFSSDENCETKLLSCYSSALSLISASGNFNSRRVIRPTTAATVLLGSGVRGIPVETAARIASRACAEFQPAISSSDFDAKGEKDNRIDFHFILRDEDECEILIEQFSMINSR